MVLFVIASLNVLVDCKVVLSPVVLALLVAIHVKFDATFAVNGILTVPPLHIVAVVALVIVGVGFTVTVATTVGPVQPLTGVIVYVTVPVLVLVVVKVWVIVEPDPAEAPLTPDCVIAHE